MRRTRHGLVQVLGLLVLCAGAAACRRPPPAPAPSAGIDVRHYSLVLSVDPASREIEGRVRLTVAHDDTVAALALALGDLEVVSVHVDGEAVAAERGPERLVVPLRRGGDTSHVEVVYRGVPEVGLYAEAYAGQQVLFTDSWPDRGRGWLPAVYHPADPATFDLTLRLPAGYEAAASGTLQAVDTLAGAVQYRWRLSVPAPAYTFAFAAADFSVVPAAVGDTLPVRYYMLAADSAQAARLARTPEALAYFSQRLGPYAFPEYESVQVPMQYAGMENASASFLQAALFATDVVEEVQVHEVAHQWFGNRVVPADWRDLWLSEGTATYLTTLFYEEADGPEAARRLRVEMAVPGPDRAPLGRPLVPEAVRDPEAHLTWVPYRKGGSVLHLLRLTLGDEAFFAALRSAYARFAGRPLSTEAFRELLEQQSGRSLERIFDFWVYGTALPGLATTWDPEARQLAWRVTGDAGTLSGVPFELEVRQGERVLYVPAARTPLSLPDWSAEPPVVRPVGIMMDVE